ncbi:MAG: hypothetical protein HY763_08910, partial [Planctomycetes bacterium]|nr:hypothetical protein [Planctomycetota bacterium]
GAGARGQTNDACANQATVRGVGTFAFANATATPDGPSHPACVDASVSPLGSIDKDVWFCWTSPCSGAVQFDTCGQTTVDTKIAVYSGCACPGTDARLLACNDDACGLQSRVTFPAQTGQSYLIRVGTYPGDGQPGSVGAPGGTGTFRLTCVTLPCDQPGAQCQPVDITNGNTSDRLNYVAAENFVVAANDSITELCWWGSYQNDVPTPDTFLVTYYAGAGGFPGSVIGGPFSQAGSTLSVTGPVDIAAGGDFPVFEYTATHAPVPVSAGNCYWVEISNATDGTQSWFWHYGFGGDSSARVDGNPFNGYEASDIVGNDLAFCLDVPLDDAILCPPPPHPACVSATGSCCAAHATPACDTQSCCDRVCACDDFCCTTAWDSNCAGTGLVPGCGAALLCRGMCVGDFDDDEDVDLDDYRAFQDCQSGPGLPPAPTPPATLGACLAAFDIDTDQDLDQVDWAAFELIFSPP